ncbi:MAG TPA: amino acid ABC transporter permease [Candidatus Limnocylindrales bacterium]|nr:amino acid ABC transporter permease [Candidatus Limnocylindrales bacterium]
MSFDVDIFLQALTSKALREAVVITISLAVVSFVIGVVVGLLVALARASRFRALRVIGWLYVWLFRAIPTIILLFFVWNALPQLIPALAGPGFLPFYAAVIGLSMNEAAYAAEIIRGGLLSVDDGQRQAARALGMRPSAVFRRIVAPQVTRVVIPPMANDFITLLKLTSLAYVTSLREILSVTQTNIASNFRFAEWYSAAAIYYIVLVSIFMVGQAWLEQRFVWTSVARSAGSGGILRGFGTLGGGLRERR